MASHGYLLKYYDYVILANVVHILIVHTLSNISILESKLSITEGRVQFTLRSTTPKLIDDLCRFIMRSTNTFDGKRGRRVKISQVKEELNYKKY